MRTLLLVLFTFMLAVSSFGAIRRVAKDGTGDYTTIQAAINTSATDDTVIVSGTTGAWELGSTSLSIDRRIVLLGQGFGCDTSPATSVGTTSVTFADNSDGAIVEGFYFYENGSGSWRIVLNANAIGITIRRCHVEKGYTGGTNGAISISAGASLELENSVIDGQHWLIRMNGALSNVTARNSIFCSSNSGIDGFDESCHVSLSNCAFLNMGSPMGTHASNWQLDHNIFWQIDSWNGTVAGSVIAGYNAVDNTAYTNFPGTNKVNLNGLNPFSSYSTTSWACTSNLHLHPIDGLPLINSGNPDASPDRDGSRRDFGIYGGPTPFIDTGAPDFPFVTQLVVPTTVPQNGVLEIRSTGRVGQGGGQ